MRPVDAPRVRLSGWHQALVFTVLAALLATGIIWLVFQFITAPELMGAHPAQVWSLRVHGGLAMVMGVVAGTLMPRHVATAWRLRRNRLSGSAMLALLLLLAVTGWLLYYAGPEWRDAASWAHWVIGLVLPVALAVHWLQRKR